MPDSTETDLRVPHGGVHGQSTGSGIPCGPLTVQLAGVLPSSPLSPLSPVESGGDSEGLRGLSSSQKICRIFPISGIQATEIIRQWQLPTPTPSGSTWQHWRPADEGNSCAGAENADQKPHGTPHNSMFLQALVLIHLPYLPN